MQRAVDQRLRELVDNGDRRDRARLATAASTDPPRRRHVHRARASATRVAAWRTRTILPRD